MFKVEIADEILPGSTLSSEQFDQWPTIAAPWAIDTSTR
jgi:hypothetical protein